jgi:6-phosphofructokinase 1
VADQLASHIKAEIRVTVLGHIQRGGLPIAFDRVLATEMGVKAFELADSAQFGKMVSYARNTLVAIPIADAVRELKQIAPDNYLVKTARYLGVSLGD